MFLRNNLSISELTKGVEFEIDCDKYESEEEEEGFDDEQYSTFVEDISNYKKSNVVETVNTDFSELKKDMASITDDGLVLKKVVKSGVGLPIPDKAVVLLHYEGYLEKKTEPFDSTRLRHKPYKFLIGDGNVLFGLELGIKSMKKGEVALILLYPEYGFGEMGCPPRIPQNAKILYKVEILNFYEAKDAIELEEMSREDQISAPFSKVINAYHCEKVMANDLFHKKLYKQAIARYKKAVRLLETVSAADEKEDDERNHCLLKLYLNLAQCYLNINQNEKAITYSSEALKLKPNDPKGLYRIGVALYGVGRYNDAEKHLNKLRDQKPYQREVQNVLVKLQQKQRKEKEYEKVFCQNIFGWEKTITRKSDMDEYKEFAATIKETLLEFVKSDANDYFFPPSYTEDEVDVLKEVVQDQNLKFVTKIQDNEKIIKVSKPKS